MSFLFCVLQYTCALFYARHAADSLSLIHHFAGKYTSSEGEADCIECGAGKYASQLGTTACVDCAAGKHLASTGNDAESDCVACAAGSDTMPRTPFGVNECVSITMAMALSATPACTSAPARFYHAEYLCLHL